MPFSCMYFGRCCSDFVEMNDLCFMLVQYSAFQTSEEAGDLQEMFYIICTDRDTG